MIGGLLICYAFLPESPCELSLRRKLFARFKSLTLLHCFSLFLFLRVVGLQGQRHQSSQIPQLPLQRYTQLQRRATHGHHATDHYGRTNQEGRRKTIRYLCHFPRHQRMEISGRHVAKDDATVLWIVCLQLLRHVLLLVTTSRTWKLFPLCPLTQVSHLCRRTFAHFLSDFHYTFSPNRWCQGPFPRYRHPCLRSNDVHVDHNGFSRRLRTTRYVSAFLFVSH